LRFAAPREWQTDQPEGEPRYRNEQQRRRAVRRCPCNARDQQEEAEQQERSADGEWTHPQRKPWETANKRIEESEGH